MFIALMFAVSVGGEVKQDYLLVESQSECIAQNAELEKFLSREKTISRYYLQCVPVSDLKKPGVKA